MGRNTCQLTCFMLLAQAICQYRDTIEGRIETALLYLFELLNNNKGFSKDEVYQAVGSISMVWIIVCRLNFKPE